MTDRLTDRERILRSITEKQWQTMVTGAATWHGWFWYHNPDSRRSTAGWPDLMLVRRGRFIFAELKKETGTLSVAQKIVLNELRTVEGLEVYVWRPSDETEMKEILA